MNFITFSALTGLGSVAIVAGQSTRTVDSFLLDAKKGAYVGSVVNVSKNLTTLVVDCAHNTDCGWANAGATIVQGPSDYTIQHTSGKESTGSSYSATCVFQPTANAAKCQVTNIETMGHTTSTHITAVRTISSELLQHITITAGAEKLPSATASSSTSSEAASASSPNAAPMVTGAPALAGMAAIVGVLAL